MPRGGSRIGAGRPKRSAAMLKLAGVTRSDRLPAKPASVNTQRRKQDIETQYRPRGNHLSRVAPDD